jgi:hypothetical protein
MYTSLGLVALAGFFLAPSPETPAWRHSYHQAREEGQRTGKPLAVVIGSGQQGYEALADEGQLSPMVRKLLAAKYVPVYVDVKTSAGRRLAQAFAISEGTGIVLSDRSGELQAFYHDGALADADLVYYLRRFAEPGRVVQTTEQVPSEQTSSYPPQADPSAGSSAQPYAPPSSAAPVMFGGFGGGGGC